MKDKIILIRHGESVANVDPKYYSFHDSKIILTKKGVSQCTALSFNIHNIVEQLHANDKVTVIASGMTRAQLTAKHALTRFPHVPVKHDDRISECHWGNELQIESNHSVLNRVKSLINEHREGSLILFTHGELMRIVDPIRGPAKNTEYRIYDRRRFEDVFLDRKLIK